MPFNSVSLLDISPDRSQLLTVDFAGTEAESQFWGLPLPSGMPRRIEGVVGHDGSWSRDGRHLVFARGSDINVANADGSDIHRLLSVGGRPFALRFSPNGTLIRFSVLNTQTNSSSISEIRTTGTSLRSLLPGSSGLLWACCGDWTADGRYYIFESGSSSRFDVWALPERSGLRRQSSTPIQLTNGPLSISPVISDPNSHKLFAVGVMSRGELVRFDDKSRQFVPYLSGISAGELDFSRDGRWVTYVSYPEGSLWRSRLDGSERLQLTYPPVLAGLPRWSPDGTQIAYVDSQPGQPYKIFLMSAQGGTRRELLSEAYNQVDPTWSPDGKKLAFGRIPIIGEKPAIQVMDLSSQKASLLPGSEDSFSPRWSPDGRYLAAATPDSKKLVLYDFTTQKWSDWVNENGYVGFINWSPDGRYMYYDNTFTDHPTFRRIRVGGTHSEFLADLNPLRRYQVVLAGAWSGVGPDGAYLFVRDLSTQEVYAMELEIP